MQILRLVPRRPAGQTAGIDPKLLFVAKNGTPQIDVKHPLRIAVLDASIGRIATLQKPQGKGRNPIHTGSSEGPSKPADVDPTTMPKVMRMRKSMRRYSPVARLIRPFCTSIAQRTAPRGAR